MLVSCGLVVTLVLKMFSFENIVSELRIHKQGVFYVLFGIGVVEKRLIKSPYIILYLRLITLFIATVAFYDADKSQ